MTNEIWKDIKGYEGFYQVSNLGRVKSLMLWNPGMRKYFPNERMMTPTDNGNGYKIVGLVCGKSHRKNHYVHRLVAEAFIPRPAGRNYINHKDYDTSNNRAENLEWCTQKENTIYSAWKRRGVRRFYKTNTGERYIYLRKGRYRLVISHKEYPSSTTLEEAVAMRDRLLSEVYGVKGVI